MTGSEVKAIREKHNITQEALAKEAGIAQSTLSRFETGAGPIDEATLSRLKKVIAVLDTPTIPDALIDVTAIAICEKLIHVLPEFIDKELKTVKMPGDYFSQLIENQKVSFSEIENRIASAEIALAKQTELTITEWLDDFINAHADGEEE